MIQNKNNSITDTTSNDIALFTNEEFGNVRAVTVNGEPYFVGKDVAAILGYSNPRKAIIDHVDEDDKTDRVTIRDSIGREQNPVCINESGLYSLILSSKLPTAKKFKRWIMEDVLSSIKQDKNNNVDKRKEKAMGKNNTKNNEISVFNNEAFGTVRALNIKGEPYFVGKDVADILGYKNTRDALMTHVDEDDKNTVAISDGNRGNPNQTVINESGLYSLILSSKLPNAKKFKRWVTSEVLPSIRKNGGYIAGQETMTDEELMAKAIIVAQNKIAERDAIIETMLPKVEIYDRVMSSEDVFSMNEAAKQIGIGRQELFSYLRDKKIVSDVPSHHNLPYQRFMNAKYFTVIEAPCMDGKVRAITKVTPKGVEYLYKRLTKDGVI